ncbi:MAG: aryldialkylphosphatase [Chloroflexi bacterium]|nr:aryldialkylphosphatase [Chloroflexota bacterium]
MTARDAKGKVLTVRGPVDPQDLGITLTHEHLLIDLSVVFVDPGNENGRRLAEEEVGLANLGWIRVNWSSNRDNLVQTDVELATREAARYRDAGGGTLVDATSIGIHRNPEALAKISRAAGIHVVMGAGYYVGPAHPKNFSSMTVDSITDEIVRDIEVGVGDTGIRSGIIGEIGCSWPWTDNEKKSVAAAVAAQRATGAPLLIHPGRDQKAPIEIVKYIDREGGDLSRTVMSHVDIRIYDRAILRELAATGTYIEYDTFGLESPFPPHAPNTFMPSDYQRIEQLMGLIWDGHLERVVLAHDNCTKHRLREYGGHGFDHIPSTITGWMKRKGMSQAQIDMLLIENPRRVLTFV